MLIKRDIFKIEVNSYLKTTKLNDQLFLFTMRNETLIEKENQCSHVVKVTLRLFDHDVVKILNQTFMCNFVIHNNYYYNVTQ